MSTLLLTFNHANFESEVKLDLPANATTRQHVTCGTLSSKALGLQTTTGSGSIYQVSAQVPTCTCLLR